MMDAVSWREQTAVCHRLYIELQSCDHLPTVVVVPDVPTPVSSFMTTSASIMSTKKGKDESLQSLVQQRLRASAVNWSWDSIVSI